MEKKFSLMSLVVVGLVCLAPSAIHVLIGNMPIGGISPDSTDGLGIKDLIRRTKAELTDAENEMLQNHEAPLFQLKDFEMEISFVVEEHRTEKGKIEYRFVAVEGERQTGMEKVQKLNLHWQALQPTSGSVPPSLRPLAAQPESTISYGLKPPVHSLEKQ